MGGSIKIVILLFITLGNASFGFSQSVFNVAFDESNTANLSHNALELNTSYYFTQVTYKNNNVQIEAVELDSLGGVLKKKDIVTNNLYNLYYGYAGSLQYLSINEFCQLYKVGPDSALRLVFFDTNLVVTRDVEIFNGHYCLPSTIKQINDSTIISIGEVLVGNNGDLLVVNSDLNGNVRWQSIIGDSNKSDYASTIEVINNEVVIGGQTYANSNESNPHVFVLDEFGGTIFDTIYKDYNNGGSLAYHSSFGVYLSASKDISSWSIRPVLLHLNGDYSIGWAKEYFRDKEFVAIGPLVITDNGTITTAGSNWENGSAEGLFFQTNHLGDSLGSKLIDHIPGERAQFHDIRATSDGGYIMAGEAHTPGQDSWIVKVNEWGCDNIPCIVGVDEVDDAQGTLNCYPNPTNGSGTISGFLSTVNEESNIKVFNSIGQLIQTIPITQKDFEVQVNLTQSGLYLVNLYQGNELVQSVKWVVR